MKTTKLVRRAGAGRTYQWIAARVLCELVLGFVFVGARPVGGGGADRGQGVA